MKRLLLAATASAALAACAGMGGGDWVTLIDGDRGLENFNQVGDGNWRVENGAIVADRGQSGFLVSKMPYGDFQIYAEFWAEANTNSGVFIRCSDPAKLTGKTCYEVNIWDLRPEPKYGTGAIVDVAAVPVPIANRAGGRWNTYLITAKGEQLTVELNGVQTASVRDGQHSSGYFGLQYGAGLKGRPPEPIKWRQVRIRAL